MTSAEQYFNLEKFHCRHCPADNDLSLTLNAFHSEVYEKYVAEKPTDLLPVACKLARIHSDEYLEFGPDSAVFWAKDAEAVLKIYPNVSIENLTKYQHETSRVKQEFPEKMRINDEEFEIDFAQILHIEEVENGHRCTISYSPFMPGKNQYHVILEFYKNKHISNKTDHLFDYSKLLSEEIGAYYQHRAELIGKKSEKYYLDPRNFKIDFDNHRIVVTDLACNIPNFIKKFAD